jgi:hypothetical protein
MRGVPGRVVDVVAAAGHVAKVVLAIDSGSMAICSVGVVVIGRIKVRSYGYVAVVIRNRSLIRCSEVDSTIISI